MKLFDLVRKPNGRLQLYCCGKRIFSFGRRNVLKPSSNYFIHRQYGQVWYPFYSTHEADPSLMTPPPLVYNSEGQRMEFFFLRDKHLSGDPYRGSKYFLWDRYNIGLDTHFYSHQAMLETMGKPTRKYGFFIEPPSITPIDYTIFDKYASLEKEFDAIFTADTRQLDTLPNAKFFPASASIWYQGNDPEIYQKKTKGTSILSSNKHFCELHRLRIVCAERCKRLGCADTFGTFDGGARIDKDLTLTPYRYSIVVENVQTDYFFTEKILDCFAAQTIPIYCGAGKIGQFFNPDGIIRVSADDLLHIEDVLKQCTPEEYNRRLPAILDNYARVQAYRHIWDWLYEQYFLKKGNV